MRAVWSADTLTRQLPPRPQERSTTGPIVAAQSMPSSPDALLCPSSLPQALFPADWHVACLSLWLVSAVWNTHAHMTIAAQVQAGPPDLSAMQSF